MTDVRALSNELSMIRGYNNAPGGKIVRVSQRVQQPTYFAIGLPLGIQASYTYPAS